MTPASNRCKSADELVARVRETLGNARWWINRDTGERVYFEPHQTALAALTELAERLQVAERAERFEQERAEKWHGKYVDGLARLEAVERERDSLAARLRALGYNVTEILAYDKETAQ